MTAYSQTLSSHHDHFSITETISRVLTCASVYIVEILNTIKPLTRFHIHSAYYLVILYSFRNLCRGLK
ncbi:hypothetical protein E2C01_074339 [Portunus trituberculatus]|uniref:Uncharacterized protein n=1 Tax=Portunus trituberculatus TaxID=210409 RepID=A0A5B7IBW5_PORTR|nr:hypothetical protein [Portunus trituberculatus]